MKPRVLIVDDEETIRKLLKSRLERDGWTTLVACNAEDAKKQIQDNEANPEVGVVITDLKMPGEDGFSLIQWAKKFNDRTSVIVITGHGEKDAAVKALRLGSCDYLEKPFDLDELSLSVSRAADEYALRKENAELVARLEARIERIEGRTEDRYWFVSKSAAMESTNEWLTILRRESLRGIAEEPCVLITGESGTGKEGIARMIHAGSRRGKGPWVAVNCANFNEQLLESELFGHERGAFTGAVSQKRGLIEIARGGTLFLDEIGEMDLKLQARLLRVLQEKIFRRLGGTADLSTDVRVVAATNRNLEKAITDGGFREDLYHRIAKIVIDLPPLRSRTEEIVPMATEFCERAFKNRGKSFPGFGTDAEQALKHYRWPGNIRELLNIVDRVALVWENSGKISAKALSIPGDSQGVSPAPAMPRIALVKDSFEQSYMDLKKKWTESFEREYLTQVLHKHGGNVSAAAREARLDRSNFLRLLRRYSLNAQAYRKAA